MGGIKGKFLFVDLSNNKIQAKNIFNESTYRKYLGGSGLGAKLFLDTVPIDVEPLSPENTLFILAGPIVGTNLPGSSRFAVCAKSPQTGIWGEGTCGGNFGPELKMAGYDGIIVEGKSDKPVYLFIEDGKAELRNASNLWGKDTYFITDYFKQELEGTRKVKVLSIGPAGENLIKFSAISNDKAHFIGRTGMGAVMGYKNLKAVVVRGSAKVEIGMPIEYDEVRNRIIKLCKDTIVGMSLRAMGTDAAMDLGMMTGDIPIKNWSVGQDLELSANLGGPAMSEKYLTKNHACYACPIACKRVVKVSDGPYQTEEGPGPEYETCCTFGTMIVNKDLAGVIKANEICNKLGLDTISCGATIAFAFDCYEKGIFKKSDTDGLELTWGNIDSAIKLLDKITYRQGLGDILAEGVRSAAKKIGRGAEDLSAEVKGLELPMHDPRGWHGMGLGYALSSRGACHLQHLDLYVEQGMAVYPEIGLKENYKGQTSVGKAEMNYIAENIGVPCGSALICIFVLACISAKDFAEMIRTTTGWRDYSLDELLECGERLWLSKRGIINLMGITSKDDSLPKKIMTPVKDGPAEGSVPDLKLMLDEYYKLRGLDKNGKPLRERLERFGLKELTEKLYEVTS